MRARRTKDTVEVCRTQMPKGLKSLGMVWGFCLEATEGLEVLKAGWWFNQWWGMAWREARVHAMEPDSVDTRPDVVNRRGGGRGWG